MLIHQTGDPVATRGFDRENLYREMSDPEVWSAFRARCERLVEITEAAALDLPADAEVI